MYVVSTYYYKPNLFCKIKKAMVSDCVAYNYSYIIRNAVATHGVV